MDLRPRFRLKKVVSQAALAVFPHCCSIGSWRIESRTHMHKGCDVYRMPANNNIKERCTNKYMVIEVKLEQSKLGAT